MRRKEKTATAAMVSEAKKREREKKVRLGGVVFGLILVDCTAVITALLYSVHGIL